MENRRPRRRTELAEALSKPNAARNRLRQAQATAYLALKKLLKRDGESCFGQTAVCINDKILTEAYYDSDSGQNHIDIALPTP